MNYRNALLKTLSGLLVMGAALPWAQAQTYPAKVVRIIVPFPAGAGADITTRLFTPKLTEALGQQVLVDNRSGAAGNVGALAAARSAPDGYTLLSAPASLASSPSLYKNLGFDLARDFEGVALLASAPFVLAVHPSVPAKSVKELIALAKAQPGFARSASRAPSAASPCRICRRSRKRACPVTNPGRGSHCSRQPARPATSSRAST